MPKQVLTHDEMHGCRKLWLSHSDLNTGFDVAAQHAALLGARMALSDPHAATIEESMEVLKRERHRASELERQYAEAKDAISLEPLTHPQFMDALRAMRHRAMRHMDALRAMRQKNADLQTFLQISDDARVNMMERMATLTHWKENAIRQMAELEKEQRHLHSLLKLMHSTMAEIESLNELLTRP